MNDIETKKLVELRTALRGTRYFIFQKGEQWFMYREVADGINQLVFKCKNVSEFIRKGKKAAGV